MNASLTPKRTALQYYGKTGAYLFSILGLSTLCIYTVVYLMLYGNTAIRLDELGAVLKLIGIEALFTVLLTVLLFLGESFQSFRMSKR